MSKNFYLSDWKYFVYCYLCKRKRNRREREQRHKTTFNTHMRLSTYKRNNIHPSLTRLSVVGYTILSVVRHTALPLALAG